LKRILSIFLAVAVILCGIPLYQSIITTAQSPVNLITNPGFENGLNGWNLYNGATDDFNASAVTDEKHEGEKSLYRYVGGTESVYNQLLYQELELEMNAEYTLSFWIKGDPGWGRFYIINGTTPEDFTHGDEDNKALYHHFDSATYADWTKLTFEFSPSATATYSLCFYFSGAATNVYLDDFSLVDNYRSSLVQNGSFSDGNSGWEFDESYFTVNSQGYIDASATAHKVLSQKISFNRGHINAGFIGWLNQVVSVTRSKKYNISIDVFMPENLTEGFDLEVVAGKSIDDVIAGNGVAIALSDFVYGEKNWQTLTASFTPDSTLLSSYRGNICFALRSSSQNSKLLIDNVKFGTLLGNTDFESTDNTVWMLNSTALSSGAVTFGQNYKLSFKYKGVGFRDNVALWCLSYAKDFNPLNTYTRGFITEDAPNWQEADFVFNSGTYSSLNLVFQTLDNVYSLDNISISPTNDAVTVELFGNRAVVGEDMSGSYYSKYKQPKSGRNIISNDDFVGTSTGKYNDALNFVTSANGGKPAGTIVSNSKEADASYLGNSSLKFSAGLDEERVTIPLSLDKDTAYWVTLYIKAGPYVADSDGWSRFSYGIADTSSGDFIRVDDLTVKSELNKQYTDKIQFIPRYDGEWHYVGFKFTTNSQTDLSIMLRGSRMTAYVDKLYVWKASNSYTEDFKATLDKVGPVKNIKAESTLLDIGSGGTNLIPNSDLENGDEFWGQEYRRVGVYGNNLNIVHTGDIAHKNAFLYENEMLYPWNCYYINWIDVKPNTNYTFSAKYLVTEAGEGYFGVIPGYKNDASVSKYTENHIYPTNGLDSWVGSSEADMYISKWDFSEANYDANYKWKTVGVTFNSGDRNRVGFYVQDGGGAAYIDDIKLFETKYAVPVTEQEVEFPDDFIINQGSISIVNGAVEGVSKNTTLSELRSYFEYSDYIRFFDKDGNEITDLTTVAKKGIELRLMNGPVVVARAVIAERNLMVNGGFEDGLSDWVVDAGNSGKKVDAYVVTDKYNSGTASLHRFINNVDENGNIITNSSGNEASIYNQTVYKRLVLEPNSTYKLSFYALGDPAYGRFIVSSNFDKPYDETNKIFSYQWMGTTFADWTKQEYTFTTDERTEYILSLYLSSGATDVYFDDFTLTKESNIITNPGFENGLEGWTVDKGNSYQTVNAEATTSEKHSGEYSLHRWLDKLTYNQTVYQKIKLKPNAKYSLSFWVMGAPTSGRFYVSPNVETPTNRDSVLIEQQLTATYNDWTKLEYTFTTTEQSDYILCLLFQSAGVDVYFDDFKLELYEAEGDISLNGITDSEDLILMKKYLIGSETNKVDDVLYDITRDSNINILDLVRLKKLLSST